MMRRLAGLGLGVGGTKKGALAAATAISRPVFKLLNDQGNREWEASLSYAAASIWFAHNELPGSATWCQTHSEEERMHALKIFQHLAGRRIEDGHEAAEERAAKVTVMGKGQGFGFGEADEVGGAKQAAASPGSELATEEPQQTTCTFAWDTTPNVQFDIKGPFPTTFSDPVAIWRSALEQERSNSRRYFELMQTIRAMNDFTTEHLLMSFFIPEQLEEEKAVEEIYNNALLVTKRGPELYLELDNVMQQKPH